MRKRFATLLALLMASPTVALAAGPGPFYAVGDYYAGTAGVGNHDAGNTMTLSGGVWSATVIADQPDSPVAPPAAPQRHEFTITNVDASERYFAACNLWVHCGAGDPVTFTFDTNAHADGWLPATNIVWSNHAFPAGTTFEVIGSAPETGAWGVGVPTTLVGTIWTKVIRIATPGAYSAKFRSVGTWDICNIGAEGAGAACGADLAYTATAPNTAVKFEFDQSSGRARTTVLASEDYYVRGDFYAGTAGLWNYDTGNTMSGAGGVWTKTVIADQGDVMTAPAEAPHRHEFKIANAEWSEDYFSGCNLWVHCSPGDHVTFTLDTNDHADGWLPSRNIVWSDHAFPANTTFELMGSAPETGAWTTGVPAARIGTVWTKVVTIATPGTYAAKFRVTGTWEICNIGSEGAGAVCGAELSYTTFEPNVDVKFEFNQATGRARATVLAPPTYYAMGDFYAATVGPWGYDAGNTMTVSGGVYSTTVVADQPDIPTAPAEAPHRHEFKIGNANWSESYFRLCNLWVHCNVNDRVTFTLDTNNHADGWLPARNIVWSDHAFPAGTTFELMGSAPETGAWTTGVPAARIGTVWTKVVTIATPGTYAAKFRVTGTWEICNIGAEGAGAPCGANLAYTTTRDNTIVKFEFNQATGRARVTIQGVLGIEDHRATAFALEGATPNPSDGRTLKVAFVLPASGAARLELLDLGGRRMRQGQVGSLGAGRHVVDIADGRRLAPGLYWVRLVQGTNQRAARVTVLE